jgi:hypothetical protein
MATNLSLDPKLIEQAVKVGAERTTRLDPLVSAGP